MTQPLIAGVDEAGRGCLAGPVIAGAVILPERFPKNLLKDSKTLSEAKREQAFDWIEQNCVYAWGEASPDEIDKLNIRRATELAMRRAVSGLRTIPQLLRIDGRDKFRFEIESVDIIRGDSLYPEISAAGIVAKVIRDRKMKRLSAQYKVFRFHQNKGYGVKHHLKVLAEHGPCAIHRKSFEPVRSILEQGALGI